MKTGITKLDDILGGGLPQGKSMLILSDPGAKSIEFLHQAIFTGLREDKPVIYITNNKRSEAIIELCKRNGWDLLPFLNKNLFFVDIYSILIGTSDKYVDPKNIIKTLMDQIRNKLKETEEEGILAIDSLSLFYDMLESNEKFINLFKFFQQEASRKKWNLISFFVKWAYEEGIISQLKTLSNAVLEIKTFEEKIILRDFFTVSKADWVERLPQTYIPFTVVKPGGIKVFIPKILVTGPFNAGKSSFVHSASINPVSVDRLGTTIALDHGHVEYDGISIDLFGTPGQERFDPILELLANESLGVILIVDATNPDSFPRAREMLKKTKFELLPCVVVLNKIESPNALSIEKARSLLNLPKEYPIIPMRLSSKPEPNQPAKLNKEDIQLVFESLFKNFIEGGLKNAKKG